MNISIVCEADKQLERATWCAEACGIGLVPLEAAEGEFALVFAENGVSLRSLQQRQGDIRVDFCEGSAAHRRKFGGGKGQLIAKAVGLKAGVVPTVYDMTAGLGGDAFVLASLGCPVTMVERNPVVFALLADGLERARQYAALQEPQLLDILDRMVLIHADAVEWLAQVEQKLAVVYLDPMFPERKKSASVKKDMRAFHTVVGDDGDAEQLLAAAVAAAEYRVVVKRPRLAPAIAGVEPSLKLEGKSSRYDIYALKSLNKS